MTIGFVLTIVFIVLKLCHVIDWSWLQVCIPLIVELSISILILLIVLSIKIILYYLKNKEKKLRIKQEDDKFKTIWYRCTDERLFNFEEHGENDLAFPSKEFNSKIKKSD